MTVPKILIADSISQRGIDELSREGALDITIKPGLSETELIEIIPQFSAIVVRSQTKVTAGCAPRRREKIPFPLFNPLFPFCPPPREKSRKPMQPCELENGIEKISKA